MAIKNLEDALTFYRENPSLFDIEKTTILETFFKENPFCKEFAESPEALATFLGMIDEKYPTLLSKITSPKKDPVYDDRLDELGMQLARVRNGGIDYQHFQTKSRRSDIRTLDTVMTSGGLFICLSLGVLFNVLFEFDGVSSEYFKSIFLTYSGFTAAFYFSSKALHYLAFKDNRAKLVHDLVEIDSYLKPQNNLL